MHTCSPWCPLLLYSLTPCVHKLFHSSLMTCITPYSLCVHCRIMPSHTPYKVELKLKEQEHQSELQRSPSPATGEEEDKDGYNPNSPPQLACIEPLPVQVIERNRLSVEEIRKLPRFEDYSPGLPSKVSRCTLN